MFEVKTSTGLVLSIDQDRLENYELFEAIAAEESGDSGAIIRIVNLLLGDEAKKLKDHVRTEKGLVPISALGAEIKDVFEQVKNLKKLAILARMIAVDEDALVCDLAETYGIYDYRQLPINRVAVFACGLSESSRIKKVLSGQKEDLDTLLLAGIYDTVRLLFWAKTKDGQAGRNRPNSVAQALEGSKVEREERVFSSGEEFERAMRALEIEIGGEGHGD